MLLKTFEEITLIFDNEQEALGKWEEIKRLDSVTEIRVYKDYCNEFCIWVYKISYKRVVNNKEIEKMYHRGDFI